MCQFEDVDGEKIESYVTVSVHKKVNDCFELQGNRGILQCNIDKPCPIYIQFNASEDSTFQWQLGTLDDKNKIDGGDRVIFRDNIEYDPSSNVKVYAQEANKRISVCRNKLEERRY